MKHPVVELSACVRCNVCVETCPAVFEMTDSGFIIVKELDVYPEEDVNEAIKNCPEDCIFWEEES